METMTPKVWQYPPNTGPWWSRCPQCAASIGSRKTYTDAAASLDDHIVRSHAVRRASPQAWRRLREAIGPGESKDIAADMAEIAGGNPDLIEKALMEIDWESRKQAQS